MKIAAAQIKPVKGDVEKNIAAHIVMVKRAVTLVADVIVFPELSLMGYEPTLANALATTLPDTRFNEFQVFSDNHRITICVGMPMRGEKGVHISMVIFAPQQKPNVYAKQFLHEDELPFFVSGSDQYFFTADECRIAPAICYESLLPEHVANVHEKGGQVYMASVAKTEAGLIKGFRHYPVIAKKYSMPVVTSNSVGVFDNFVSAGKSSIWNSEGSLVGQLDSHTEGIILFDTRSGQVQIYLDEGKEHQH